MSVPAMVMEQELAVPEPAYNYTDAQLLAMIRDEIVASGGEASSRIEQQREDAYSAYYGEFPAPLEGVASEHVSRDVLDAVEGTKAKLLRTFSSTRSPVYFESTGKWDIEGAEVATDAVKTIFYRENRGYRLLSWAFHDALLAKFCVFKRVYRQARERIPESFTDVPVEVIQALAGREDVEVAEITGEKLVTAVVQTPYGPVARRARVCSGVIYRLEDKSGVFVDVVPPECFGVMGNARTIEEAPGCWERHEYSRSELIADGYDRDLVDGLSGTDITAVQLSMQGRNLIDDSGNRPSRADNERKVIPTYEVYLKVDMDGDGEAELWQFILAGQTLLSKERVAEMPYLGWSPLMLSHKAIGMSMADVTLDLQRTSSNLVRGAVDHLYRTNNPARIANLSGSVIRNPKDLISNPPGLIIDSDNPMAVTPLQQPSLNPATFSVVEIIRQEQERRTGLSRLAQGLNGDAVSNQNAEDMIAALMNASNERILEMARSFAEVVLKPLFEGIYRLAAENGQLVEMNRRGQLGEVDVATLGYRPNMTVNVALTEEELARRFQVLAGLHGLMKDDEQLSPLYGIQERYGLVAALFDLAGYSSAFLGNPSDPQVKQRLMSIAQNQAKEKAKAEQLATAPLKIEAARVKGELDLKRQRLDLDAAMGADGQDLDEAEFQWQQRVDTAQYQLERSQRRPVSLR